jgi:biopolymer transport protein ExbD
MKIPHSGARSRGALQVEMTPMIDMVFLLIVYFVWTSGMQAVERLLPARMSTAPGTAAAATEIPPAADFEPIVIRLDLNAGQTLWSVNAQPCTSLPALQQLLRPLAMIHSAAAVIIHPAPTIELGTVIDTYDQALLAGFTEVQFAAEEGAP